MGTAYTGLLAMDVHYPAGNPAADDATHAVRSVLDLCYALSRLDAAVVPSRVTCGLVQSGLFGALSAGLPGSAVPGRPGPPQDPNPR
jgi:hypothetical protein